MTVPHPISRAEPLEIHPLHHRGLLVRDTGPYSRRLGFSSAQNHIFSIENDYGSSSDDTVEAS